MFHGERDVSKTVVYETSDYKQILLKARSYENSHQLASKR